MASAITPIDANKGIPYGRLVESNQRTLFRLKWWEGKGRKTETGLTSARNLIATACTHAQNMYRYISDIYTHIL